MLRRHESGVSRLAAVALLVAGVAAGAGLHAVLPHGATPEGPRAEPAVLAAPAAAPAQAAAALAASGAISFEEGFAPIVRQAAPAVVNISASRVERIEGRTMSPFFDDPIFRRFFEQFFPDIPRERRENSLGSGVIVRPDGYILTNHHVVEHAQKIKVTLDGNRVLDAEVVGTDPRTDVAVLKVNATDLPSVPLGDPAQLEVGHFVLAIGNPFGLGKTVTLGIVSATGRGGLGIEAYEDFIQTDAAINPGNSGGALVDVRGRLVGINTAIFSPNMRGNVGIGFAIPVDMAQHVMQQILEHGRVIRGYLGVRIQAVTAEMARALGLPEPRGALVAAVEEGTPAAEAGLKREDVIVELDGEPVRDSRDLQLKIARLAPGTRVKLGVVRQGERKTIAVKLGELPEEEAEAPAGGDEGGEAPRGIAVQTLTPELAERLRLPADTEGVVVTEVEPGSPWEEAGLRRGDAVLEVNRAPVRSAREFRQAVRGARGPLLLLISRGGRTLYLAVDLD